MTTSAATSVTRSRRRRARHRVQKAPRHLIPPPYRRQPSAQRPPRIMNGFHRACLHEAKREESVRFASIATPGIADVRAAINLLASAGSASPIGGLTSSQPNWYEPPCVYGEPRVRWTK